jgi:hypothetical protein
MRNDFRRGRPREFIAFRCAACQRPGRMYPHLHSENAMEDPDAGVKLNVWKLAKIHLTDFGLHYRPCMDAELRQRLGVRLPPLEQDGTV